MMAIGGLIAALGWGAATWEIARLTTRNLPSSTGSLSLYILVAVSVLVGFLAGSAICRRARHTRSNLALFSGVAGGFAGGVVGCAFAVTMTAAYLASYSSWPQDRLYQVLVLLSYPIFGGLGLCAGGFIGLAIGACVGGVLRLAAPAR